jgi:uncharacterized membrane protein
MRIEGYTTHMSRETVLIILAVLVAVSPFSGLPLTWLSWILPVIGLALLLIGISMHQNRSSHSSLPLASVS